MALALVASAPKSLHAEAALTPGQELQRLAVKPLATASATRAEKALATAIAANPAKAADYLEALFKAGRKKSVSEIASFVRVAITALGEKPSRAAIIEIVSRAIRFWLPEDVPAIVGAAVAAAPAEFAAEIVERAIALVRDPSQMVGGVTLAEAILNAALAARPGLDAVALGRAAERGFNENLATQFAGAAGNPPVSRFADQPNRAAVVPPPEVPASR